MSVIPFRPKKVEDEHAPEELGNPLALRGSPQPAPTPETIALARQRQRLRRFVMLVPALLVSAYVIYWALTLWSHKVDDDLSFPTNVRQTWSSPWAGVTASILEREYESNGWAPSAEAWMPAARLTAKPAWQTSLVEALGQHAGLAAEQALESEGEVDADLATAARLLTGSVNPSELRAAREAFVSYDGRVRRHRISGAISSEQFSQRLMMMTGWAEASSRELMDVFHTTDSWPLDDQAVVAIYRARARGYAAHRLISSIDGQYRGDVQVYRDAALRAWGRVAQFSPLIIVNGSPDSMLFTSHAASMRAMLLEAERETRAYAQAITAMNSASEPVAGTADADANSI
ncbi:MAG: hypothetical protein CME88_10670 [Hirschia sp.]|nr:hypothetical protein [Hirschia sp.]MBF18830.1 hypothetical protein [Hirschia sp.]